MALAIPKNTLLLIAGLLVAGMVVAVLLPGRFWTIGRETGARPETDPWAPAGQLSASPELLELGRRTFEKECAACHGLDGEGEATYLLYPRPRDFASGQFRLVSTWDSVPTDEDLFRTISRGMPSPSAKRISSRQFRTSRRRTLCAKLRMSKT